MSLMVLLGAEAPTIIQDWEQITQAFNVPTFNDELDDDLLGKLPVGEYAEIYQSEIEFRAKDSKAAENKIARNHLILARMFDDFDRFRMWRALDYTSVSNWFEDEHATGKIEFEKSQFHKLRRVGKFFRIFQNELTLMQDILENIGNIDHIAEIERILKYLPDTSASQRSALLRQWLTAAKDHNLSDLTIMVQNARLLLVNEARSTGQMVIPDVQTVAPVVQVQNNRRYIEGRKASWLPKDLRGSLSAGDRIDIKVEEKNDHTIIIVRRTTDEKYIENRAKSS